MPSHPDRVRKQYQSVCPNCENAATLRPSCPLCEGSGSVNTGNLPQWWADLHQKLRKGKAE